MGNSKWVKSAQPIWAGKVLLSIASITSTVHFTLAHCAHASLATHCCRWQDNSLAKCVCFDLWRERSERSLNKRHDHGEYWMEASVDGAGVSWAGVAASAQSICILSVLAGGWVQLARLKRLPGKSRWSRSRNRSRRRRLRLTKVTMLTGRDEVLP